MDINFTKEDIAFRDEVREWLANDYPKHVKEKTDNGIALTRQDMVDYHKALSKIFFTEVIKIFFDEYASLII